MSIDKETIQMTLPFPLRGAPIAVLALATIFAWSGAEAQGTAEQREACAADAVNLCLDTIPDVPKTTACMKMHFAQLSPRCQKEFSQATGISRKLGRQGRVAGREESAPPAVAVAPTTDEPATVALPSGLDGYEAQIRAECQQGLIDAYTCRNTLDLLRGME